MKYCDKCGVELDSNMNFCPLCGLSTGKKVISADHLKPQDTIPQNKISNDFKGLTAHQKRKLFWELSSIILISGIIVTLIINLLLDKNITWARYNLAVSLALFLNITFFTFWRHKPLLLFCSSLISNSALLMLLDLLNSNIGWGTKLGVPILVSFYFLLLIVIWLIRIANRRGFNILAILFIAIGLFSICIEACISLYLYNNLQLRWSIIASASMIPISALLFFVHYRLKAGVDLKRFFHI